MYIVLQTNEVWAKIVLNKKYATEHGQATDMKMKAFEFFWRIFTVGNF